MGCLLNIAMQDSSSKLHCGLENATNKQVQIKNFDRFAFNNHEKDNI